MLLFLPIVSALVATSASVPNGPLAALRGPMEKLRRLRSGAVVAEASATEQMVPILVEVEVVSDRLDEFLVRARYCPAFVGTTAVASHAACCSSSSFLRQPQPHGPTPSRPRRAQDVMRQDCVGSRTEPGCLRFDVMQDKSNPCKFWFYEVRPLRPNPHT